MKTTHESTKNGQNYSMTPLMQNDGPAGTTDEPVLTEPKIAVLLPRCLSADTTFAARWDLRNLRLRFYRSNSFRATKCLTTRTHEFSKSSASGFASCIAALSLP